MKYSLTGIGALLLFFSLFTLASASGEYTLALTTYTSSEAYTGGIHTQAGAMASTSSGSASVGVKTTLTGKGSNATTTIEVRTETNGVVHKESVQKTSSGGMTVEVSLNTGSTSTSTVSTGTVPSSVPGISAVYKFFQWFPRAWHAIFWFF